MNESELVFHMGQYEARFPTNRLYATNHMWAEKRGDVWRFGFSAYAVRLLQDVYFLEWMIEPGMMLEARQEIGTIESKKAEASLYAPIPGRVVGLNEPLLHDPSSINVSPYDAGWLFELAGDGSALLTPADYLAHLEVAWPEAERTIKGQLGN